MRADSSDLIDKNKSFHRWLETLESVWWLIEELMVLIRHEVCDRNYR